MERVIYKPTGTVRAGVTDWQDYSQELNASVQQGFIATQTLLEEEKLIILLVSLLLVALPLFELHII